MNKSVYKIATTILLMLGMRETFACIQVQPPRLYGNSMRYEIRGNNGSNLNLTTQYFRKDQDEFISDWFSTPETGTACFDLSQLTNERGTDSLDPFTITMKLVMQSNLVSTGRTYDGYTIYKLNNNPNLGLIFDARMRSDLWSLSPVKVNDRETVIGTNQIRFSRSTGSFGAVVRARYILLNKPTSGTSYTIPAINEPIFQIKTESNTTRLKQPPYRTFKLDDQSNALVNLSTNGIDISNPIKSCLINGSSDQNIPLREIYKREIVPTASGSTGSLEAHGGNFSLDVDCTGENNKERSQLKPPKVFVTFNGQHGTTNDGNNDLLNIQTGTGKAKGVSLRLKQHDNNTSIKFGKKFQMADATGSGYSRNNFDVYYVNNQSVPVAGGEVKAATTFTLYYQ